MKSNTIFQNFLWRFAERCGAQLVSFVVSIILARLLMPNDYGLIALVVIFITVLNVFVDSGLGSALIQKKDSDEIDFSTVFYFNIGMCMVLYFVIFFCAPYIALFYKNDKLVSLVRVLGLTVVVSGVKNVQQAYVTKHMMFKKFFISTLCGTIIAAFIGIILAYKGFGVWALVAQQLFNLIIDTIVLWVTVPWRPTKVFSLDRFKLLFSFGWKMLVSALIDTVYGNIRALLIGRIYSPEDLAYYNQGERFPQVIVSNINTGIDSVLLPVMAQEQDDIVRLKSMTRRSIKTSTYIMAPFMIGIAVTAPKIVMLLLSEKWMFCVPFMRIFCVTYMFFPIHTANLNAIKALGKSDVFLKLEIFKKLVGLGMLLISMPYGVLAMAYSALIIEIFGQLINTYPNKKLLDYPYFEQIKDIMPGIILACIMGCLIKFIDLLMLNDVVSLFIQIITGIIVYIFLSYLLKLESFVYLLNFIRKGTDKNEKR